MVWNMLKANNKDTQNNADGVVLMLLLLTVNKFLTLQNFPSTQIVWNFSFAKINPLSGIFVFHENFSEQCNWSL